MQESIQIQPVHNSIKCEEKSSMTDLKISVIHYNMLIDWSNACNRHDFKTESHGNIFHSYSVVHVIVLSSSL